MRFHAGIICFVRLLDQYLRLTTGMWVSSYIISCVLRYLGINLEVMHDFPILMLWAMCASSGTTSISNVTFLSCDNTGSITDGTVTYPIVSNLPSMDVNVPRCVAGRISTPRLLISYPCRNESHPGTTGVKQCSRDNMVTVRISGERHSDWVLLTLVGIGANCEHSGSAWCCTVRVLRWADQSLESTLELLATLAEMSPSRYNRGQAVFSWQYGYRSHLWWASQWLGASYSCWNWH